eukprot:CAMPEP_0206524200 /NCGR_PEP_ID=MMETSP0324_2-20121206/68052_1 /ASSEMBLY_ACC=CAM_ASM_000836 /TAXON_ID=2866 /ORGANISM="Crypthecodinium cohnii, Strain Seligo" /LENGTH=51 /DNA_ID=CAMNT_0054018741 /DNA_START=319 /DNA_END=474 /DNA_ORIENTATION=+
MVERFGTDWSNSVLTFGDLHIVYRSMAEVENVDVVTSTLARDGDALDGVGE